MGPIDKRKDPEARLLDIQKSTSTIINQTCVKYFRDMALKENF